MPATKGPTVTRATYLRGEQEYLQTLSPEHFMEAFGQGRQREITLESLALVTAARSDVHVFNELLVQYPWPSARRGIGQVCPDNMVVVHAGSIKVNGSFNVPFQPARPFWMLEYVSKHNSRKDYEDNLRKYERELKVPYYLLFRPEAGDLTLHKMKRSTYGVVATNPAGRLAIPELDLEVARLHTWVRFWYRGELLPLPAELAAERDTAVRGRKVAEAQATAAKATAEAERSARAEAEAELQRLKAELAAVRGRNGKS